MKLLVLLFCAVLALCAEDAPPRPRILGVAHISLFAHDLDQSRKFYHDFLGFAEPYSLKNADGSPSLLFFKINDRQYIEIAPEREAHSDRLNHIAIETDNAEAMRVYLRSKGINTPDHLPKGRIGNLNFMIQDPAGHSVEVVQYPADSWTARQFGHDMPPQRISQRMMHVGIIVTKLEPEMKFYRDVLGFEETWRGSSNNQTLSWINLKVPDGPDYVEFMLSQDAPAPDRRGSAHHLSLEVPDAAASVAELNRRPYRNEYGKPIEIKIGKNRKRQVNLFDPDGTRTELMEPATVDGKPAPSSDALPPVATK